MALFRCSSGGGGGTPTSENASFTIAYGTPVTLNFTNSHSEFLAVKSTTTPTSMNAYICSDGIKDLWSSNTRNWVGSSASDSGGYAWSNDNKTLTLTMPRNYYAGTYNIVVM